MRNPNTPRRHRKHHVIATPEAVANINPENMSLQADFLSYLSAVDRTDSTIEAYGYDLRIFWVWLLEHDENKLFTDLASDDYLAFQDYIIHELEWSPARIRRVKATLSALCRYVRLFKHEKYPGFVAFASAMETPPEQEVMEKVTFSSEELEVLLNTLVEKGKYNKACLLSLAMNSGRRKSELLSMKTSYFTDENILFDKVYKTPELVRTKGRGRIGKPLVIYTLATDFRPYLDLWIQDRSKRGVTSQWLIPRKTGEGFLDEKVPVATLESWADTFSNILGKPFYWHSLRHYFTTKLFRMGLPPDLIRDVLGWESVDMAFRYCDETVEERLRKYL